MENDLQTSVDKLLPHRISALKEILKDLEVLINFLSVQAHVERDDSVVGYMESMFGAEPAYLSNQVKLKHVKHVWLLVKYRQTDLLKRQHQVRFLLFFVSVSCSVTNAFV